MQEDSWGHDITPKMVEEFQAKHGKNRTRHLFAVLGQTHDFYQAASSKVGKELLGDLMDRMDILLSKIGSQTATPLESMEYTVCKNIFDAWCKRIKVYETHIQKLVSA